MHTALEITIHRSHDTVHICSQCTRPISCAETHTPCKTSKRQRASVPCSRHYGASGPDSTAVQRLPNSPDLNWCTIRSGAWCRSQSSSSQYSALLIWSGAWLLYGPVCSSMSSTRRSTSDVDGCVRADGRYFEHLLPLYFLYFYVLLLILLEIICLVCLLDLHAETSCLTLY